MTFCLNPSKSIPSEFSFSSYRGSIAFFASSLQNRVRQTTTEKRAEIWYVMSVLLAPVG
jgi:hypothetical protein